MAEAILANVNQDNLKASLRFLDKQGEMNIEALKSNGSDVSKAENLEKLFSDESFVVKLAQSANAQEAKSVFSAYGLELTIEEVNAISYQCAGCIKKLEENNGELSEEDLEKIAGGTTSENVVWFNVTLATATIIGGIGGAAIGSTICPGLGTLIGAVVGVVAGGLLSALGGYLAGWFD